MKLFRHRREDGDFAAEIQAHLDLEADQLHAGGRMKEDAAAQARRAFGNVAAAQERFYEANRRLWFDRLAQDLRYAVRTLRRAPAFTAAAIVSLALGIGANTAIFSTIDEVLLRPPAVPEPNQLAQVYSFNRRTATYVSSSYADYADFRHRTQSFQHLAAYVRLPLNVVLGSEGAERVSVEAVSDNYFDMLRLPPLAGRTLRAADDLPGAPPAAMVAEDVWRNRFQADPGFIGRTIRIEGVPFTVAGIVPRRLTGLNLNWATPPQIWIPLHGTLQVVPRLAAIRIFDNRAMLWLVLMGRLQTGVDMARAQAELRTIAAGLAQTVPAANRDLTALVFPLSRSKFWPAYRTSITASLAVFAVAAGLVLLLACANVSNLLLERALSRRREFAVRLAIGAGRSRLVRQLLTESLTLAAPACAVALLVAQGLMKLLLRFPNALGLPLALDLTVESRTMLFCVLLSLVTTALFGLAPAWQATRPEILPALNQSGNARSSSGQDWLRGSLVMVQVAFSTILLIGGGLYGRNLLKAYSVDLGFRSANLLTADFSVGGSPGTEAARRLQDSQQMLLRQLSTVPGVLAATTSSDPLLGAVHSKVQVDAPSAAASPISIDRQFAGPDFFRTLGCPVLSGRDFTIRDDATSATVAIVNQALAARLWPGGDALGRTIYLHEKPGTPAAATVVGVAHNAKYGSVWEQPQPHLFLPLSQSGTPAALLAVRINGNPAAAAPAIRQAWSRLAPSVPLDDFQTADERVNLSLTPQRIAAGIFGAFGLLAIALASVGLYSLVAYSVVRQRREIGIRIAIGAQPRTVLAAILRSSMLLTAFGLALGASGSLLSMRFLAHQVREISPYDGPTYLAVVLLLAAVAGVAALIPARRAMRVDPCIALRCD
jgi:predicted permease